MLSSKKQQREAKEPHLQLTGAHRRISHLEDKRNPYLEKIEKEQEAAVEAQAKADEHLLPVMKAYEVTTSQTHIDS